MKQDWRFFVFRFSFIGKNPTKGETLRIIEKSNSVIVCRLSVVVTYRLLKIVSRTSERPN